MKTGPGEAIRLIRPAQSKSFIMKPQHPSCPGIRLPIQSMEQYIGIR
jgi:hypothetical protein